MTREEARIKLIHDYQTCFGTSHGKAVLKDLARFCAIGLPITVQSDPVTVYGMECMRRTFWYIYQLTFHARTTDAGMSKPVPFDFEVNPFKDMMERTQ